MTDLQKRAESAAAALELVKSWPCGAWCRAKAELDSPELQAWEARFCAVATQVATTGARVSAFHHLRRWCEGQAVDVWAMSWADVEKYLHLPTRTGKFTATRARFCQLQFLADNWGLPVPLKDRMPPAAEMGDRNFEEGQALAIDPCIVLAVEDHFAKQDPDSAGATASAMT